MANPVDAATNAATNAVGTAGGIAKKAFKLALKAGTIYGAFTAVAVLTGGSSVLAAAATQAAATTGGAAIAPTAFSAATMAHVPLEGLQEAVGHISNAASWLGDALPAATPGP